ncbi:MAG: peptide chain release factor N(5)-glutamine methyltransferase [Firmicutes bacterium]|nr:peptide chain release factor N(5)-glutamine methyltransferase [Bacillota bacterium]
MLPKKVRKCNIGGMAVYEGIMFISRRSAALAVRNANSDIIFYTKRKSDRLPLIAKIPILRGPYLLVKQMLSGYKMFAKAFEVSYDFLEIDEEERLARNKRTANSEQRAGNSEQGTENSEQRTGMNKCVNQADAFVNKTSGDEAHPSSLNAHPSNTSLGWVIVLGLVLGLALAVGLFFILPTALAGLFNSLFGLQIEGLGLTFFEGGIRIIIFLLYLSFTSLLKDIRRIFMYHAAEHKVLNCYERGMDLSVENVQLNSRRHARCGTAFLFLLMITSILVFSFFAGTNITYWWQRILLRVALVPLIAGLSYEILRLASNYKIFFVLFYPLVLLGLLMQSFTTRKPSDDIVEVAIAGFNKVLELDENSELELETFPNYRVTSYVKNEMGEILGQVACDIEAAAETDLILQTLLSVDRGGLERFKIIDSTVADKALYICKQRAVENKPLQYLLGSAHIYGVDVAVNSDVLIPRMDTEILIDEVIKSVQRTAYSGGGGQRGGEQNSEFRISVLDLCTGSGIIAIALAKEFGDSASVMATDICEKALGLAKQNAKDNGVSVNFIQSDLFESLGASTSTGGISQTLNAESILLFDIIVSNPPYIKSADINNLDDVVKHNEPRLALDGGADGLDFYRRIANEAKGYINKGGKLLLEIGADQAEQVKSILAQSGDFADIKIVKDLNGLDRVVKATRS